MATEHVRRVCVVDDAGIRESPHFLFGDVASMVEEADDGETAPIRWHLR
jgi:hypothetical protein